jgi:hypothetical protein
VSRAAALKALAAAPSSGTRRQQILLENLFSKWNNAPGGTAGNKRAAIAKSRKGAPPTGLGFRQLRDFFKSRGLNNADADLATMAFYNHAPALTKIGTKWVGINAGTALTGPKNNVGQMPKNNLKNYLTIVNGRSNNNANKIVKQYYP